MIDPLNRIAALWWTWMSGMFWQVGLLIVIVACLDALMRRWAWPQVRYTLWLMVMVKLVLPPDLHLPSSISSKVPELALMMFHRSEVAPHPETVPQRVFQKLIVGPSPSEKPQGTKAEAGDVGSIVDAGRQSHGALQPGEARATFKTPSRSEGLVSFSIVEASTGQTRGTNTPPARLQADTLDRRPSLRRFP